jgi:lipopolysaccharide transport system ATP-binding protein
MSELAIRVEHLGKQYRLGGQQERYSTFREALVNAANAPLRWLKGERRVEQNSFWALDDVSFEVKHGDAVGIIGRNGAGKSTLLKILSRITSPTRGRVDIYGRVGSLLEVGTGFHPELTGRENIFLNGAILGMSRVEISRKFEEIVDFSGVEKFLDTPVKHYSSGMYVRLAFAVAAHLEPEILLVDEVLAVGDAEFQKKCLGKMGDVAHEGRTVLFVSHNMGAIGYLCNKAIYFHNGVLINAGITQDILSEYISGSKGRTTSNIFPENHKRLFLKSARLIDLDGKSISEISMGYPFSIEMKLINSEKIINLRVLIQIFNASGIHILGLDSYETDKRKIIADGTSVMLLCKIINNQFLPGTYHVDIVVGEPNEWIDKQSVALTFEVLYSDVFNTGREPTPLHNGTYWTNHLWDWQFEYS